MRATAAIAVVWLMGCASNEGPVGGAGLYSSGGPPTSTQGADAVTQPSDAASPHDADDAVAPADLAVGDGSADDGAGPAPDGAPFDAWKDTADAPRDPEDTPGDTEDADAAPGPDVPDTGPPTLCFGPWDCADDDPCTLDRCVAATNHCEYDPIPGCCHVTAECATPPQCSTVECVDDECVVTPVFPCCLSDAECDDGLDCTVDQCVPTGDGGAACEHGPIAGCCSTLLHKDFTSATSLVGWEVDAPGPDVSWQVSDQRAKSQPSALYMGDPETGTYVTTSELNPAKQLKTEAAISTPQLDLGGATQATATFWLWLDIGGCADAQKAFDLFRVFADTKAVPGVLLLDKCAVQEQKTWTPVTLDLTPLSSAGKLRLRFDFDSVDEEFNDGEGIWVDDLAVEICY